MIDRYDVEDTMSEDDYTGDCLDDSPDEVGVEELRQVFCSRCWNDGCVHSQSTGWKWRDRMERQKRALKDPVIGDPDAPRNRSIANQDFVDARRESIDPWKAPSFQGESESGRRIVHEADPPTSRESSESVDEASRALKGESDEDDEPDEKAVTSNAGGAEPEEPENSLPDEEDTHQSDRASSSGDKKRYNTEAPEDGLMLPGGSEDRKSNGPDPEDTTGRDAWSAPPEEGEDDLVVRIDDGKRVDED